MLYFEDRGSILDAPIDVVWDFILKDHHYHPKAHRNSLRKMKWKDLSAITGEGTCEVFRGGKWSKMKFRVTSIPPFVRIAEEFVGLYAGQKMVFLYTSKGKRTGIDVFVLVPRKVAEETRRTLAKAHEEDIPMLEHITEAGDHRPLGSEKLLKMVSFLRKLLGSQFFDFPHKRERHSCSVKEIGCPDRYKVRDNVAEVRIDKIQRQPNSDKQDEK
jgi:hypothetical protein